MRTKVTTVERARVACGAFAVFGAFALLGWACAKGADRAPPGGGGSGGTLTTTTSATGGGGSTTSASGGASVGGGGASAGGAGGGVAGGAAAGAGPGGASTGGGGGAGAGGAAGGAGGAGGASEDPPGPLAYQKVQNNLVLDDLRRVRWHSSGAFALMLGAGGKLVRYDVSGGAVSLAATLGKRVEDLEVAADGSYFLVVGTGNDDVGRLWRVTVDGALQLAAAEEATLSLGQPRAIERNRVTNDVAIGAYGTDTISYLYIWHDGAGITKTKGFNSSAGLWDVTWGDPALFASDLVVTSHGVNGADSRNYVLATDLVVSNNWSPGFGNAGGAGWRPSGSYGILTGWSSNKLYVYDGAWSLHTLPGVGTAASPQAIGWNASGTRALVVGRAIGPGLRATVTDYRPSSASFSDSDLVDQSIANFDVAPWFGNSSSYLFGIDWRPGTSCAEGLMVGNDNGPSLNPTFGTIVRFYDLSDPDCP